MSARSETISHRPPGMPCPACRAPIVVDPQVLLSASAIHCESCGLELRINVEQSAAALDALRRHMHALSEVKAEISVRTEHRETKRVRARLRAPRRRAIRRRGARGNPKEID